MTMFGPVQDRTKWSYHRQRCKTYACGICGPKRLRGARRRIVELAQQYGLQRLLTLTLDPSKLHSGQDSIKYVADCWSKLRVYLKRELGRSIVFVAVKELQRSGLAHLHVLIGAYVPQAWLSQKWAAVGGGRIVDIRWVDIHRVSAYMSKYLTKEALGELPEGVRRFSMSRGLALWPRRESKPGWQLSKLPIELLLDRCRGAHDHTYETEADGARVLIAFVSDRSAFDVCTAFADAPEGDEV